MAIPDSLAAAMLPPMARMYLPVRVRESQYEEHTIPREGVPCYSKE
jgi:hypothetical protein